MSADFCTDNFNSLINNEELLFYITYCNEKLGISFDETKNLFTLLKRNEYIYNIFSLLINDKKQAIRQAINILKSNQFTEDSVSFSLSVEGKEVHIPKIYSEGNNFFLKNEKILENEKNVKQLEEDVYIVNKKLYFRFSKNVLLLVRFLKLLNYSFFDYDYFITKNKDILVSKESFENIFNFTENPYHMFLKFSYYGDYYKNYFVLEFFKLFVSLLLSGYTKINPNNFSCSKVSNFLIYLENIDEDTFSSESVELIEKYTVSDKLLVSKNMGFTGELKLEESKKVIKNISENLFELNVFPMVQINNMLSIDILNLSTLKLLYYITDVNLTNQIVNRLIIVKNVYA